MITKSDTAGEILVGGFVLVCTIPMQRVIRYAPEEGALLRRFGIIERSRSMCLRGPLVYVIPDETARIAHAAFPKGNPDVRMRETLGPIFANPDFAALFPQRGQPAQDPARLALVTILQFAEDLSDRQAADAVRARLDWKYMLALELDDPGFDASVLSEFRTRLLAHHAEQFLFETLLATCREHGLLKAHGRQRTDSTHVLAAIRALNRLELVAETMRHTLNVLAAGAPDWLRSHCHPEWVKRYERRPDQGRLPTSKEQQAAQAELIGGDGRTLLQAIYSGDAPVWVRQVPAVELMRRIWVQNYLQTQDTLQWRSSEDLPPATLFISSPYDTDAHLAKKGSTCWVGYKAHFTETCEDDAPSLITHVETSTGPIADGDVTSTIHAALKEQELLPTTHIVDTGYVDAELLVTSPRDYGVELLGPTRANLRWQARAAAGFGLEDFRVEWEERQAICPEGHASIEWVERLDKRGNESIYIRFSPKDCGPCPCRAKCTQSQAKYPRRSIAVRPREQHEALQAARAREHTAEYKAIYAKRAGCEGTISRAVRTCGLRRSRYIGDEKVHLEQVLIGTALNFLRVSEWLAETPKAKTRRSAFVKLMAPPAPS
jgi:transposase